MRHTLHIIIIITMACLAACSRHYDRRLITAESVMTEHPDSALAILQAIDSTSISSEKDRALFALLMTQALDKNHINVTDDSLITIAADYYSHQDDRHRDMLAHYYLGRVH